MSSTTLTPDQFRPDDPAIQMDPYPFYPVLREERPVLATSFGEEPCWVVSRREDVSRVLMDPATYSSRTSPIPMLLFADRPEHGRLRGMVGDLFTRQAVAPMADTIRTRATAMLDRLLQAGQFDVTTELAGPLTLSVIGLLLGIDTSQVERLRGLTKLSADYVLAVRMGRTPSDGARQADADLTAFVRDIIESRAEHDPGVVTVLAGKLRAGELTLPQTISFVILLLVAGHSTTTNLLGNAVFILTHRPQDLERLAREDGFAAPFIEEVLRMRPSFHRIMRITTREVELGGERIPEGAIVRLLLASANGDPAAFEDPDTFNADAVRRGHFAFGQGVHSCLGTWLARLEATTTIQVFGRRVSAVSLDPQRPLERFSGGTFNEFGFESLPVLAEARR